jgi:peptide-methionine (S)-S-oxide reductase
MKATFGMGCFWKGELIFSKIRGVLKTEVGYMGGVHLIWMDH